MIDYYYRYFERRFLMRTITKKEAEIILHPYIDTILNCVKNSVNSYFSGADFSKIRPRFSKRTDASICHDLIIDSIVNEFESAPRTRCFYRNNLFLLIIEEKVVLRFKMFDQNLLSHSIPTKQLFLFNNQDVEQLELPDMPPHALLHVGYCLNELRTKVKDVYITYRKGNYNLWDWLLTEEIVSNVAEIQYPEIKTSPAPKRKVTAKNKNIGDIDEAK
jgi:hypothetical protein